MGNKQSHVIDKKENDFYEILRNFNCIEEDNFWLF